MFTNKIFFMQVQVNSRLLKLFSMQSSQNTDKSDQL